MPAPTLVSDSGGDLMRYIETMDVKLSDRSKHEYTARLKEIRRQIPAGGDTLTPEMVLEQLRSLVGARRIAASTFRIYKSAVMYWLGQQAQALIASDGDHGDYSRAFQMLRTIAYAGKAGGLERTSAKKLKAFPQECVAALVKFAQERGHRAPNAVRAVAFAKANLLVGLRPSEWFDTAFGSYLTRDDKGDLVRDPQGRICFTPMLIVENAKATHGRGNGQRRELVLHGITADELKTLVHFREIALQFLSRHPQASRKKLTNVLFRPINNMIRRALLASGYANRAIPACYSTRHQAMADFKASGISPREIAAFFGHSSQYTHRQHYGHKRHGARAVTFRPSQECLARVAVRKAPHAPEVLPALLATEIDTWAAEQLSRKTPETP
jgi:integrase